LKPEEQAELERFRRENDALRKIVAESNLDCIYCGLSASDMGKCAHGFPGCGRADDMLTSDAASNSLSERCRMLSDIALSAICLKLNIEHGFAPNLNALNRDLAAFDRRFGGKDGQEKQDTGSGE